MEDERGGRQGVYQAKGESTHIQIKNDQATKEQANRSQTNGRKDNRIRQDNVKSSDADTAAFGAFWANGALQGANSLGELQCTDRHI